jgi:hypothetical protein
MRTLNMDRELLHEKVGFPNERGMGIEVFMDRMRAAMPGVRLTSSTPYEGRVRAYVS